MSLRPVPLLFVALLLGAPSDGMRTAAYAQVQAPDAGTAALPVEPPPAQPGVDVAEARWSETNAAGVRIVETTASASWRTKPAEGGTGELDVVVEMELPEQGHVEVTWRRNADPALPASHLVEVRFSSPVDARRIAALDGILVIDGAGGGRKPMAGVVAKVLDGQFLFGMGSSPGNAALLRDGAGFELPLRLATGTRAVLGLTKGEAGRAAFAAAFESWRVATQAEGLSFEDGMSSAAIAARIRAAPDLAGEIGTTPPEGALMPGRYRFETGMTREAFLGRMLEAQASALDGLWRPSSAVPGLRNATDLVTLASIVQAESAAPEDMPRVARVYLNRLARGMRLQSDATVLYGLAAAGETQRRLTPQDLRNPTPYNTYAIPGLPPAPIGNPGRAALEAVARPAEGKDLYFVTDRAGGMLFAETLAEHSRNVAALRKASP